MPHMIIIAGPNGAGKTTTAPALLQDAFQVDNFIHAGRIMLKRIHSVAAEGADFAFETTLATRSFASWMPKIKKQGYTLHLLFFMAGSPKSGSITR